MKKQHAITLSSLLDHLKGFAPDSEVIFGDGDLRFYRTKSRGPKLVQIEFSTLYSVNPGQEETRNADVKES
ncbi:hypothetical protein [uncultured Paludibaculum sp.]|uniref:hypothetical protein n=1 Tax=uncultured Paludibaculum sp. TaxID=1765020 RepID=UPI002AABA568|nr:hypothetical protein [uncultured Paludibaculum sp.]